MGALIYEKKPLPMINKSFSLMRWQQDALRDIKETTRFSTVSECIRYAVENYLDFLDGFDEFGFKRDGTDEKDLLEIRTTSFSQETLDRLDDLSYKYLRSRSEIIRFALTEFLFELHSLQSQQEKRMEE